MENVSSMCAITLGRQRFMKQHKTVFTKLYSICFNMVCHICFGAISEAATFITLMSFIVIISFIHIYCNETELAS